MRKVFRSGPEGRVTEIRGFLLERGITFAAQPTHLRKNLPAVMEDAEQNLTPRLRWLHYRGAR